MQYRRARVPGGRYFFTAVTRDPRPFFNSPERVELLRQAFRRVRRKFPFAIDAIVVLPDHLHCIWTLPAGDADYPTRWRLIKSRISRESHAGSVWQPRYWEHLIRDEVDFQAHVDYIHYNPVRHGYAHSPLEWPYSSLRSYVRLGVLPASWGNDGVDIPETAGRE